MKNVRVRMEDELHREFKAATAADGTTMTRVILVAIAAYLERRRAPQPQPQEPTDA